MKVYRNTREIKKKEAWGRRLSLIGLAVLFIGLLSSFVPTWLPPDKPATQPVLSFLQYNWFYFSFGSLFAGFVLASFGSYYINRFAPRRWPATNVLARPDELVERSMKGFDNKYSLFLWSLPSNNYLCFGPCGAVALIVRGDKGRVRVEGDRWREPFSFRRLLTVFAREGIGDPSREIKEQTEKLRELLMQAPEEVRNGDDFSQVPIEGAVIFINPQIVLDLQNPAVTVLRSDQVKDYLRRQTKEVRLKGTTLRSVGSYLASKASAETSEG